MQQTTAQSGPDGRVKRLDADESGSVGLVVESSDGKNFILTCSHVAMGGRPEDRGGYFVDEDIQVELRGRQTNYGCVRFSFMDNEQESALVELSELDANEWRNELPDGTQIGHVLNVPSEGQRVSFFSSLNYKEVSGEIIRLNVSQITIEYGPVTATFDNLIEVGMKNGSITYTISEKGDSGSVVYSENYEPIGMIIGGNSNATYIVPIQRILDKTETTIKQHVHLT